MRNGMRTIVIIGLDPIIFLRTVSQPLEPSGSGKVSPEFCESGNFGTCPSYDGISQLLGIAQVRFPGRK